MIILGHIRVCQSKTKSCSHFRQLSIKRNLLFVKRRPRELKTRSAVLDVAITQRHFLASLAKWGNLFSFFFQKWRGLPAFEIFCSFLYFDISSCFVTRCFILWWGAAEVRPKKPPLFGRWFNNLSPVTHNNLIIMMAAEKKTNNRLLGNKSE